LSILQTIHSPKKNQADVVAKYGIIHRSSDHSTEISAASVTAPAPVTGNLRSACNRAPRLGADSSAPKYIPLLAVGRAPTGRLPPPNGHSIEFEQEFEQALE
jgi:hypothetical protein